MNRVLPALLLVASASCGVGEQGALSYQTTGDRDAVMRATEGYADPVSAYLRGAIGERGTLRGTYRDVLEGVGRQLGCDLETEKSFVVVSNLGYIPKFVFTRCSGDATAASRFFLALPAAAELDGDVEERIVHVAGWDAEAGVYRTYSLAPTPGTPDGEMAVDVEPALCKTCHGGPQQLTGWHPLMNEMSNPWSHWNAAPGFASLLFEEHLPPEAPAGRAFGAAAARLASAAELEPVVRAGIERFVSARLRARTTAASVEAALELVRPLFCDETVNFVSEIHDTGELRASAVVDDGLRARLRQARPGRWNWTDEPTLSLPAPAAGERPLALVPVRGTQTVEMELGLVSRGVISVDDALRVRAVDLEHPVMSDARCALWQDARDRLRLSGLEAATVGEAAAVVVREALAPLGDVPAGHVVVAAGEAPITVEELGDRAGARRAAATRASLAAARAERVCRAALDFPSAPLVDDVDCPE